MEKLKRVVKEIAYSGAHPNTSTFSTLQRSLIPFLSFASSVYKIALSLRVLLYQSSLFGKHRLPVPVISVGNLTWGGNGKTPMVEYLARWLVNSGMSPLILTRGYASGDEAKMLQRHLLGTSAKVGIGANRAAVASCFLEKYGYLDINSSKCFDQKAVKQLESEKIGAVILDDGMQHLSLARDLEILMVNGVIPWGNLQLLPLGPLREPLTALSRVDVAIIHHADLVTEENLKHIELKMKEFREDLPVFYSEMAPSHFFKVENVDSSIPLAELYRTVLLCVSAVGFANTFVRKIEQIGPHYVDRLDFNDHHIFNAKGHGLKLWNNNSACGVKVVYILSSPDPEMVGARCTRLLLFKRGGIGEDIEMIRARLRKLQHKFRSKPIVVVTEKDYDRDPEILKKLHPFEVLVLCSQLRIMARDGCTEDTLKKLVKHLLEVKLDKSFYWSSL